MANESVDPNQAGIGIIGAVITVTFIASIVVLPIFPLGTALGGYGLWFFFGEQNRLQQSDGAANCLWTVFVSHARIFSRERERYVH